MGGEQRNQLSSLIVGLLFALSFYFPNRNAGEDLCSYARSKCAGLNVSVLQYAYNKTIVANFMYQGTTFPQFREFLAGGAHSSNSQQSCSSLARWRSCARYFCCEMPRTGDQVLYRRARQMGLILCLSLGPSRACVKIHMLLICTPVFNSGKPLVDLMKTMTIKYIHFFGH